VSGHAQNNAQDRAIGKHWETQFGALGGAFGKTMTAHQIGKGDRSAVAHYRDANGEWKRLILPDITVWSASGEHHEIKHKNPTADGCYGLERYRLDSLVAFANRTGQRVFYTIHDWERAGCRSGKDPCLNRLEDWVTAEVAVLSRRWTKERPGVSWVSGVRREGVPIVYWRVSEFFRPLADLWGQPVASA
jgi:hypothetical protein